MSIFNHDAIEAESLLNEERDVYQDMCEADDFARFADVDDYEESEDPFANEYEGYDDQPEWV